MIWCPNLRAFWCFNLFGMKPVDAWITLEQAKLVIEAEIARRGWGSFDQRTYQRARLRTGGKWLCRGFVSGLRSGVMIVEIDGRTGELLRASVDGR